MLLFRWICLLLPLQIVSSLPTPATDILPREPENLESRQLVTILAAILTIVTDVIGLIDDIFDTLENLDAAESKFTVDVVSKIANQYPDKNILIYHDQDSDASGLVNTTHQHVEFSLGILDFTKGYEIYVFDYGTFYRAGDGGYANWCTEGEFNEYDDNTEIVYYAYELIVLMRCDSCAD